MACSYQKEKDVCVCVVFSFEEVLFRGGANLSTKKDLT